MDLTKCGSPGLTSGSNTVEFKFNGTDGFTSGYRVLAFNVLTASGASLVAASQFVADNPAAWQPPRPGATDIAAGADLWANAEIVTSPLAGATTGVTSALRGTDETKTCRRNFVRPNRTTPTFPS